ncbi:hypothetical protein L210DRAFT_3543542 [Boletus edulis BED1]|uniref:Uncharacterized protein n=1 Tax=Boletus edulis BED1 TaxID=1328754 RepID=A0AAD4G4K5_BOLED|nr:hypothetical protein L210DRAFT_3590832 [Boletus edulis BED1]KAF8439127.1 hypothetical protein L210DRAFT_3543542 [Boletus edulis BED1]
MLPKVWSCLTILNVAAFGILVSSVTSTLGGYHSLRKRQSWLKARTVSRRLQERIARIDLVHSWWMYHKSRTGFTTTYPECYGQQLMAKNSQRTVL